MKGVVVWLSAFSERLIRRHIQFHYAVLDKGQKVQKAPLAPI